MRTVIACCKFLAFALWSLLCVPPQLVLLMFHRGRYAYAVPELWHRGVCRIFNIQFYIEGTPYKSSQVFYMCNHLSYLDIPMLGSVIKQASFLAKSEVKNWPVFGFLSTLHQTEYIERKRTAVAEAAEALTNKVANGRNLIIFPEGTSTDGRTVRPFKSSLFVLALDSKNTDLHIQPVTIKLLEADGRPPFDQKDRDIYAWHIDMNTELPVHLWRFAKSKGARLLVIFHPPLKASDFDDRKALAKTCHDSVINGLQISQAA